MPVIPRTKITFSGLISAKVIWKMKLLAVIQIAHEEAPPHSPSLYTGDDYARHRTQSFYIIPQASKVHRLRLISSQSDAGQQD